MKRTTLGRSRSRTLLTVVALLLSVHGSAKANWFADNDVALGFEAGSINSGLSAKFPYSADTSWQLTLGGGGDVNGVGLRFISQYRQLNGWNIFWHGGLSTLGVSGGIGADYDLTNIGIPIPLLVNFNFGPRYRFDSNRGFDLFDIGLGLHYRFK